MAQEYGHPLPKEALVMESEALVRFEVRLSQIVQKLQMIRFEIILIPLVINYFKKGIAN